MSQSQKVLVAGTGLSGISAAKLLLDMGGEVVLYDSNPELDAEELKHKFDEDARITIVLGELKRTDLLGVETVCDQSWNSAGGAICGSAG